jgi:outer membrane protein assembly factor BamB
MKHLMLLLPALLLLVAPARAQQEKETTLNISVYTADRKPLQFADVSLESAETGEKFSSTTDNKGKASFTAYGGKIYYVHVKDQQRCKEVRIPLNPPAYFNTMVTYGSKPVENTVTAPQVAGADTVWQTLKADAVPKGNNGLVTIMLIDKQKKPVEKAGVVIGLYSSSEDKVYAAKSDKGGHARFEVPISTKYDVCVDNIFTGSQLTVPNSPGVFYDRRTLYVPTVVTEKAKNDTIRQTFPDPGPTSARAYLHVLVRNHDMQPLPDEQVTIDVQNEKTVYYATTNKDGVVEFLLPKGKKYMLNFKYERGLDMINLTSGPELRYLKVKYTYMGSKKIEEFYATADRNEQGFLNGFMTSKIYPMTTINVKVKLTKQGYHVQFPDSTPSNTPVVAEDKMYLSGGFYSNDFYRIDTKTGKVMWGVELAEGGASPAIYEDGVILVNTESCTLYAIDANTGKLLWSHWLSNYLFTTPAAANGKVYAVYGNDLSAPDKRKHVLACFDLKTGKTIWQQWVDHEGLGSPVIAEDKVLLTTVDGKLYRFDAASGGSPKCISIHATTSPVVNNGKIYISRQIDNENEALCVYDLQSMNPVKTFANISGQAPEIAGIGMMEDMNYTGSRITISDKKHYNIIGNKLTCSDPEGNVLWSVKVVPPSNGMYISAPVVAGKKVVVTTSKGDILLYDAATGKLLKEYSEKATFWTQPAIVNGWIYNATKEGPVIAVDTKDPSLTGWSMWNGNSAHNPVPQKP